MNENIDLTKILQDCPKGFKLYSSVHGDVIFSGIDANPISPWITVTDHNNVCIDFTPDGKYSIIHNGECVLFPSKNQRDWSKFTAPWHKKDKSVEPKFKVGDRVRHKNTNKDDVYEISKVYDDSYCIAGFNWMILMKYQDQYELVSNKFDPKMLKPFDKVLVRDSRTSPWRCALYSHTIVVETKWKYVTGYSTHGYCIPYNDDTKHLVGTTDEAPEYYRYWED